MDLSQKNLVQFFCTRFFYIKNESETKAKILLSQPLKPNKHISPIAFSKFFVFATRHLSSHRLHRNAQSSVDRE